MGIAEKLLGDTKNHLDITWDDAETDRKLLGIISTGMSYLQRLASRKLSFGAGTHERALLFDYCRYARAGALPEFAKNYQTDLLTFRSDEAVRALAKKARGRGGAARMLEGLADED